MSILGGYGIECGGDGLVEEYSTIRILTSQVGAKCQ